MKKLIKFPYSVGDIVYTIFIEYDYIDGKCVATRKVYKSNVVCIHYSVNKKQEIKATLRLTAYNDNGTIVDTQDFKFSDVGILIFDLKEDAENGINQLED